MSALRRRVDVFLAPGELTVHTRPTCVKTIVGSCVAVCLCDPGAGVGGVNHYLLARPGPGQPADSRYGCAATPLLLERVCQAGALLRRLQASVIGGGHPVAAMPDSPIGDENVALALALLAAGGVRVVHQDTGGPCGRKLLFDTGTGQLLVRQLRDWSTTHVRGTPTR